MAPWGVFHTSFYGIRSFLWAVFNQEMATPNPGPSAQLSLSKSFQFDGGEYRGVLVLVFNAQTPSSTGLSAEILDDSQITEWSARCGGNFEVGSAVEVRDQRWQELTPLHRKQSTKWPDILHAPEEQRTRTTLSRFLGDQQTGLLPSTGPLWRSAHCTETATKYLRGRVAGVYAITFEEEQPKQTEASMEHKEKQALFKKARTLVDKVTDKVADKVGTLRRKM
jgi:hypothetical protein